MSDPFPAVAEAAATGRDGRSFRRYPRHRRRARGQSRVAPSRDHGWRAALGVGCGEAALCRRDGRCRASCRFRESMIVPTSGLARRAGARRASTPCWRATTIPTRSTSLRWARWSPGCAARPRPRARRSRDRACRRPIWHCRKLASEADVAPETWAMVLRLNRFGDRAAAADPGQHVSPSRRTRRRFLQARRGGAGAGRKPMARCDARSRQSGRAPMNGPDPGPRDLCDRPTHAAEIEAGVSAFRRSRHRQDGHHLPGDPCGARHRETSRCARDDSIVLVGASGHRRSRSQDDRHPERSEDFTRCLSAAALFPCWRRASHSFIASSMVMNTAPPSSSCWISRSSIIMRWPRPITCGMEGVGQDAEVGQAPASCR